MPGGAMEMRESLVDSVIREAKEETGLDVEVTGMVGTYTDPKHIIAYSDGEVRRQFNICYTARAVGGTLQSSSESTALEFVERERLDSLPIHPTQRMRLDHFISRKQGAPYLG